MRTFIAGIMAAGTLALACGSAPARAVVLLSDDFDTDAAVSALNFNAFNNWNVIGGTVDYIRSGGFGISCAGGAGGCVDMDGSTSNVGRMVSKSSFLLDSGTSYRITLTYSGNQRGGGPDGLRWGLTDSSGDIADSVAGLLSSAPFVTTSTLIAGTSGTFKLFVEDTNPTGDNLGPILDNFVFESLQATNGVPAPGTLALLGLGAVAWTARRRVARRR